MHLIPGISTSAKFILNSYGIQCFGFQQIRTKAKYNPEKWADWRMVRDVKRRKISAEYANQRLRINAIRKNNILPVELRELADTEIHALPRDSAPERVKARCAVTSRPRGTVHWHRLSRIVWRLHADYNKLSGTIRGMW